MPIYENRRTVDEYNISDSSSEEIPFDDDYFEVRNYIFLILRVHLIVNFDVGWEKALGNASKSLSFG